MFLHFHHVEARRSTLPFPVAAVNSPTTSLSSTWSIGKLRWLRGLLNRRDPAKDNDPLTLSVFDPAPLRCDVAPMSTGDMRTDAPQFLTPARFCEARIALAALLGRLAGGHRTLPSLALLERSLGKGDPQEMDNLPIWVLRHAVQTLDLLDEALFSDGLVALRRHVEQTLRRRQLGCVDTGKERTTLRSL